MSDDAGAPPGFAPLFGWLDRAERHELAAQVPAFEAAAPACMATVGDERDPILLYRALTDVLGGWDKLGWRPQEIGDCTSMGWGHGCDMQQAIEIVLGKEANDYAETCTEAIYGAGREIAGMTGRMFVGDGCYGSAMAKAATTIGYAPRYLIPQEAGGESYSGSRARSWGSRGIPDAVRAICKQYKLGGAALIRTWAEYVASIKNGYVVPICSNYGFTYKRDANGFVQPRGTWNHCMLLCGVRFDIEGAACFNSWPLGTFTGPAALDIWTGGFWIPRRAVEGILAQGDSFAISGAPEFRPRPLPRHWTYDAAA